MVLKLLQRIDDLLNEENDSLNTKELLRITKSIKTLDKEIGLTDYIDCFISFGEWLSQHSELAGEIRETMATRRDLWKNFTVAVNIAQNNYIKFLTKDGGRR